VTKTSGRGPLPNNNRKDGSAMSPVAMKTIRGFISEADEGMN
jgi:hypothetical protein